MLQRRSTYAVAAIASATAACMALASRGLATPVGGRLNPGLFPLGLALLVLVAALLVLRRPQDAASGAEPSPLRAVAATTAAMIVLALATRPAGVFLATLASATLAAAGVAGVSMRRALLIGFCLAMAVGGALSVFVRHPLPVLPPGLSW